MMGPGSVKMEEQEFSQPTNLTSSSNSSQSTNPTTSSNSVSWDEVEAEKRLREFCQISLSLDEGTTSEALRLFKETKHVLLSIIATPGTNPDYNERFWFASVLYAVKRLIGGSSVSRGTEGNNDTGFTLNHILKVSKFKVAEFLNELPHFYIKVGSILSKLYGTDWEQRLQAKELNGNFNHLRLLNRYFKRAYNDLFFSGDKNDERSLSQQLTDDSGMFSKYFRFGWMMFLALRIHSFSRFKDLVTCTNGLVSILAILILHVPVQYRRFSLDDSTRFERKSEKGVNLVSSLCKKYDTSEEDLCKTIEMANKLIIDILKKIPQPASECQALQLNDIDTDGLTYFEDLLEESALELNIKILDKDYEDAIHDRGELDERMFVNDDDSLLSTSSMSGGTRTASGVKRKYDAISSPSKTITSPTEQGSPLTSPAKRSCIADSVKMPPPTPVSETMTTAKWLRTVIAPLPAEPSPELCQFFTFCDKDITRDVIHRADVILEAIFPSSVPGGRCIAGSLHTAAMMDGIWAKERRKEAAKLYYRVLASMCRAESQRLRNKNLTSLLSNERFHRCMLACSAELVLATHKTVTMVFQAVLERTGITAFDLSKVIESFVRHEETLPRELKRHLNNLEEKFLESMTWEKGSTMYNSLIVAKPHLAAEVTRQCLLADPMPSLDAIAMHYNLSSAGYQTSSTPRRVEPAADVSNAAPSTPQKAAPPPVVMNEVGEHDLVSPVRDRSMLSIASLKARQPPLQSAFLSPTRPSPAGGGETCAETSINIFFQKVMKLVAIRIKSLSERLRTPDHIMEVVYKLMHILLNQSTSLFFNRNIDQIMLCCFYGMTKVYNLKVMFKDIVDQYKKLPYYNPHVYRNVYVDWQFVKESRKQGQETVDIIKFYNSIFIPVAKQHLVALGPNKDPVKPDDAVIKDDGPASPKASPFSNLPDLSPKKVSTKRNIYVSPLRSSKMEALATHNSKSMYACVGESTNDFQSPSKDLTAINNRLNGRRVGGRLNFDNAGLVSDSLVAGSLFPAQNVPNLASDPVLVQSQSQSQALPWNSSPSPLKLAKSER